MFIGFHTPLIRHIKKRYSWMQQGHCLMNIDDLIQVASIALLKLGTEWPDIATKYELQSIDPRDNDGLVWTILQDRIKKAISKYGRDVVRISRVVLDASIDREMQRLDEEGFMSIDVRTALKVPGPMSRGSRIEWHALVDAFSVLPIRDKIHLALRFYDGLSLDRTGQLLGVKKATAHAYIERVRSRFRIIARNQYLTRLEEVPARNATPWEPPQSLIDYLADEYDLDVAEWLGLFTISMREDISYLCDILSTGYFMPPTVSRGRTLTPEQMYEIDQRLATGETQKSIYTSMGLTKKQVQHHAHRRAA